MQVVPVVLDANLVVHARLQFVKVTREQGKCVLSRLGDDPLHLQILRVNLVAQQLESFLGLLDLPHLVLNAIGHARVGSLDVLV